MRKFYFFSAIIVAVLILVLSFAQVGASCSWYLIKSQTPAFMVLLQTALLGSVMGGLLILWWKSPRPGTPSEGSDEDED